MAKLSPKILNFLRILKSENEEKIERATWELSNSDFKKLKRLINFDGDSWDWKEHPSSSFVKAAERNNDFYMEFDTGGDEIRQATWNQEKVDKILRNK